ncbi:HDOD domain-containing protein [Pokkaliibacter sp. CJK22405]|uniref:HDOD domain-containing protein n=1 Tax=Pokkaliibacter sp. CJK22405 TaxID=3384615 RepID=UPI0039853155
MSVETLFSNVNELPSIPKIVRELMDCFESEQVNADRIATIIAKDQTFAARVLRLANSARYGVGRKVASINNAVVLLGSNSLKTLVTASGVTAAFKEVPNLDKRRFWKDTFTVATLCKMLAKQARLDPELAFTCGMMHNIGEMLIHMGEPDQARDIDSAVEQGQDRADLETDRLHYHYGEVGESLALRWKFPDEIQKAVRQHVHPEREASPSPYAVLIALSIYLVSAEHKHQDDAAIIAGFPQGLATAVGVTAEAAVAALTVLRAEADDIDALLG